MSRLKKKDILHVKILQKSKDFTSEITHNIKTYPTFSIYFS